MWIRRLKQDGAYEYQTLVQSGIGDTQAAFSLSSLPDKGWSLCDAPPPPPVYVPSPDDVAATRIDIQLRLDCATKLAQANPADAAMAKQVIQLQAAADALTKSSK